MAIRNWFRTAVPLLGKVRPATARDHYRRIRHFLRNRGAGRTTTNRHWWTGIYNFGDLITAPLLSSYGLNWGFTRTPGKACVVSTGSILEHLPADYAGVILGSGFIRAESTGEFPRQRFWRSAANGQGNGSAICLAK